MKSCFLLVLVMFFTSTIFAQNAEVTISGSADFLLPEFYSSGFTIAKGGSLDRRCVGTVVAVATPVKGGFYVGAEAGIHSGSYFVDTELKVKNGTYSRTEIGHYETNNASFFLVPEYRFLKKGLLFVKGGLGISKDFSVGYSNGVARESGVLESIDLTGRSYQRKSAVGGFLGAGFHIPVTTHLYVKGEGRYMMLPHGDTTPEQIVFGFNYVSAMVGIGVTF